MDGTASDPPSIPTMAPPGFQKASDVYKANPVEGGSMRNASGGSPPISRPADSDLTSNGSSSTSAVGGSSDAAVTEPVKPVKPINRPATSKNAIVYNAVQRRNPVLQCIRNVGIEIGDIVADYQVGAHNGVLFLSLKYHRLHPEYIHQRIEKMKGVYNVRILLVLCDINEHQQSMREISKIAIINNYTTFVAWSNDEVAQYLTTFKSYEHKGDETLKEPIHQSYSEQFFHVMTSGKKVNKTDATNIASQFGSFENISKQSSKVLSGVKGLGATKVKSLVDAFNQPFLVGGIAPDSTVSATGVDTSMPAEPAVDAVRIAAPESTENGLEVEADEPMVGSPEWPDDPLEADDE